MEVDEGFKEYKQTNTKKKCIPAIAGEGGTFDDGVVAWRGAAS